MNIFFITNEWTALKRFLREQVSFPEGMPSVYLPWLFYRQQGYDVNVFIVGDFETPSLIEFNGCHLHLIPKLKIFRGKKVRFPLSIAHAISNSLRVYFKAKDIAKTSTPPNIIYSYRETYTYIGWLMAKSFNALLIKRFFGTFAYDNWYNKRNLRLKLRCLLEFIKWRWPSDMIIITQDGTSGDKIADLLRISKEKYRFWLNGVNKTWSFDNQISLIIRERYGLTSNDFVLMCLSRLSYWKRQDRVIKAMPEILMKVPNAKLVIVGDGPEKPTLNELVKKLNLSKSVTFLGMIEHNKVRDTIGIADVFLQTNDYSCLGNSLLEAIICHRTIITWDVGATKDIVKDGYNGCLMPDAKPATIAKTVITLAKNPEIRNKLMEGARKFGRDVLLSWDERLNMEYQLISSLSKGQRN